MTDSRSRLTPQLSDGSGASFGKSDGGAGDMDATDITVAAKLFASGRNTVAIADMLLTTEASVYNTLAKRREGGAHD